MFLGLINSWPPYRKVAAATDDFLLSWTEISVSFRSFEWPFHSVQYQILPFYHNIKIMLLNSFQKLILLGFCSESSIYFSWSHDYLDDTTIFQSHLICTSENWLFSNVYWFTYIALLQSGFKHQQNACLRIILRTLSRTVFCTGRLDYLAT